MFQGGGEWLCQKLKLMSKDTYHSSAHEIFSEIGNILDHKTSVYLKYDSHINSKNNFLITMELN